MTIPTLCLVSRETGWYIFGGLCLLVLLWVATPAKACDKETWVNGGGLSYHVDRSKTHNEHNFGLGVRQCVFDFGRMRVDQSLGYYRNSGDRDTGYAVWSTTFPVFSSHILLGTAQGFVMGGYRTPILPVLTPIALIPITQNLSLNVVYVPKFFVEEVWWFRLEWRLK